MLVAERPRDLIFLDEARRSIAATTRVDDLKHIANKAEAVRLYIKKVKGALEIQNRAAEIKIRAERRAGELLKEMQLARGKRTDLVTRCHLVDDRKTLADLGVQKKQSSRWQSIASIPSRLFERYISDAIRPGLELTTSATIKFAKQFANRRTFNNEHLAGTPNSRFIHRPSDLRDIGIRFGCIYADPPWPYSNRATRGAAENHYPTLTLKEICNLPMARIAAAKSHLHLWTTSAFLFEAKQVIEAWGFTYKSCFVWIKPQLGMGNYWRMATEFLLLGVRGDCPFRSHTERNWLRANRRRHSVKPEVIRSKIEQVSPGPYLELFGRKPIEGWTVFGNQILCHTD